MREAIEKVIAEIATELQSRIHQAKYSSTEKLRLVNQGAEYGLDFAYKRIKEVLASEDHNSGNPAELKRDDQREQAE